MARTGARLAALLLALASCGGGHGGPAADLPGDAAPDLAADPGDAPDAPGDPAPPDAGPPADPCDFDGMGAPPQDAAAGTFAVDGFRVALGADGSWTVTHADEPGRPLLSLAPGDLAVLQGGLLLDERQGAVGVTEDVRDACPAAFPRTVRSDGRNLVLAGLLEGDAPACRGLAWIARLCQPLPGHLSVRVDVQGGTPGGLRFRAATEAGERVFGLGEQFPRETLDLTGRVIPVLAREQGIGRGEPAVSEVMELLSPGSSGDESTTYHAAPQVLTSRNRSFFLENTETSVFDLATPGRIEVRAWAPALRLRVLHGTSPLDLVERFTEFAGRMREPPAWLDEGAVVALARPLEEGIARFQDLVPDSGARIAAVWDQTWCGTAKTALGEQVLWNWALSPAREAPWGDFVDTLAPLGARVLCYVNPMFRDLPADADPGTRNLYREAVDAGHVVRTATGEPYLLQQGVFQVALLDLSSEAARTWMKGVLKDELLGRGRCSGWMADFAEALPFDAVLASGEPAAAWHNRYPVEWARLNREALEEAGRLSDVLVFHRSGFTTTPAFSGLQWEGDQAVTWDAYDGLRSAVHGLLNGGFSGIALNHSDAGGYTGVPVADPPVERSRELLMRWVEMGAFTSLLRTHEGNQPARNAQVYGDIESLGHFARFSRVYRALGAYRRGLFQEAAARGWPVVRHLAMHYPDVPRAWEVHDQFLLGPDVLVAPVLDPAGDAAAGAVDRALWLPPGRWRDLWTGLVTDVGSAGLDTTVRSHPGQPPVFLRDGGGATAGILQALRAEGIDVPAEPRYRVADGRILDARGRTLLLRGINVASGDLERWAADAPGADAAVFDHVADSGFDAVRLVINWDRIEPGRGAYDEAYLDLVESHARLAAGRGLYVVVDLHQDMYGAGFGLHGAPRWTCDESNYAAFQPVEPWFFNYFSAPVSACFDGFWKDHALHAHQQEAARRVALRLADLDLLLGFDSFNEPFPGTTPYDAFDRDLLLPFHAEFAATIASAAPGRLAFIEPAVTFSASQTTAMAGPLAFPAVFAPHYYSGSVEMDLRWDRDAGAVEGAVDAMAAAAAGLQAPLALGEMGGARETPNLGDYLAALYADLDRRWAGAFPWIYSKGTSGFGMIESSTGGWTRHAWAYLRPAPVAVGGVPSAYAWDPSAGTLSLDWEADGRDVTEVAVPRWLRDAGFDATLDGRAWTPAWDAAGRRLLLPALPAGPRAFRLQSRGPYPTAVDRRVP